MTDGAHWLPLTMPKLTNSTPPFPPVVQILQILQIPGYANICLVNLALFSAEQCAQINISTNLQSSSGHKKVLSTVSRVQLYMHTYYHTYYAVDNMHSMHGMK